MPPAKITIMKNEMNLSCFTISADLTDWTLCSTNSKDIT